MNVIKGSPTPEELAALVVALHVAAPEQPPRRPPAPRRRAALRHPLMRGPRGWRESSWNLGGHL